MKQRSVFAEGDFIAEFDFTQVDCDYKPFVDADF